MNNPNKTLKIVGYARVSSREQAEDSNALKQQVARLKHAGAEEVFVDVQSGSSNARPNFKHLMKLVKNKQVEQVIFTRLDRFSRSLLTLKENLEVFLDSGVNLVVLDQKFDLTTSQGKLMANLLGSLAEWETDQLSERVKHGIHYRRQQKKACMSYPWGYTVVNDKYVLDRNYFLCLLDEQPDNYLDLYREGIPLEELPGLKIDQIARDCIEIFLEQKGLSRAIRAIYLKYGIQKCRVKKNGNDKILNWSTPGLRRWLTNPVLCGHTVYKKKSTPTKGKTRENPRSQWEILRDTHPEERLLTDAEAKKIERLIEFSAGLNYQNFNLNPDTNDTYREFTYQSGLIFCAECGCKCTSKSRLCKNQSSEEKYYYYFACRHANKGCSNKKGIRKEAIEKALVKELLKTSTKLDLNEQPSEPGAFFPSHKLLELQNTLKTLEQITYFDSNVEELKQKILQQIAEEENPFSTDALERKTGAEIIRAGNNLLIWYSLSNDEKAKVYRRLVNRITIFQGQVQSISFNL